MKTEKELREKLRKIEALFSGGSTDGEKDAAKEAKKRIVERLKLIQKREKSVEVRVPIPDRWSRQLFVALCRRYGLKPYRYARQRTTSVMVKAPKSFLNDILWPEFQALNGALNDYLSSATEKIIREEIHEKGGTALVVDEIEPLI